VFAGAACCDESYPSNSHSNEPIMNMYWHQQYLLTIPYLVQHISQLVHKNNQLNGSFQAREI